LNRVPVYILDSFAALAFFQDEPAAGRIEELLVKSARAEVQLVMAVVNLGEVFYKTFREFGADRANAVLELLLYEYEIEFADVDQDLALEGARVKAVHSMSYADCIAAALTRQLGATLVTGDPEFQRVEGEVSVEWLPQPGRS